ncbi:MAG: polysaccharide deacetylase family protein [Solirubrobacteraceae bacterium]
MGALPLWPEGARAAVSITVDNLGEAAEIELGLRAADGPLGDHYSVTTALPIMLGELATAGLKATFFVEGINAEIYPQALAAIADAGHEVAYHSWCHENWAALDADAESDNLDRGFAALRAIGVEVVGFRPPGGRITPRTLDLLTGRGLLHCSPAGSRLGVEGLIVLPFSWPAVDAFHVLPAFAALRAHLIHGSEPGGPDAIREALLDSVDGALASGGHATLVLHTWMIELELDAVRDVFARIRWAVDAGELWAVPCRDVAAWMTENHLSFGGAPRLDQTSWMTPSS